MHAREKLVRDNIPDIIRREGGEPRHRRAADEELGEMLFAKLAEEVAGYRAVPDSPRCRARAVEELADIVEVVLALGRLRGIGAWEIEEARAAKVWREGGLRMGFVMEIPGEDGHAQG